MTVQEQAKWLARSCFMACFAAVVLGTINARNGDWDAWWIDCGAFLGCAVLCIVNLRLARK